MFARPRGYQREKSAGVTTLERIKEELRNMPSAELVKRRDMQGVSLWQEGLSEEQIEKIREREGRRIALLTNFRDVMEKEANRAAASNEFEMLHRLLDFEHEHAGVCVAGAMPHLFRKVNRLLKVMEARKEDASAMQVIDSYFSDVRELVTRVLESDNHYARSILTRSLIGLREGAENRSIYDIIVKPLTGDARKIMFNEEEKIDQMKIKGEEEARRNSILSLVTTGDFARINGMFERNETYGTRRLIAQLIIPIAGKSVPATATLVERMIFDKEREVREELVTQLGKMIRTDNYVFKALLENLGPKTRIELEKIMTGSGIDVKTAPPAAPQREGEKKASVIEEKKSSGGQTTGDVRKDGDLYHTGGPKELKEVPKTAKKSGRELPAPTIGKE